jgi:sugar lactone lactonase YvrE
VTITPRVFVHDTCALGEGPFWFEDRLWWVDIDGSALHSVDGAGEDRVSHRFGQRIGAAAPLRGGGFVVGLEGGIGVFDPARGPVEILYAPERGVEGSRFNDGKCDPQGRFVVGTLNMTGRKNCSALYSLGENRSLEKLYAPVTISNGLAWSADGRTMYYIDTPTLEIAAFPYDPDSGRIGSRSVVVEVPERMGWPDGMCIDTAGNLWVAHWGGTAVRCWSPATGECLAEIATPCTKPTSCCFGGPGYSRLFITSARGSGDETAHPLAGSVFVCEPGASGLPVQTCAAY